jgi:hypothetical protein
MLTDKSCLQRGLNSVPHAGQTKVVFLRMPNATNTIAKTGITTTYHGTSSVPPNQLT